MSYENIGKTVSNQIAVTPEDIARAKQWILSLKNGNTDTHVREWIAAQQVQELTEVDPDAPNIDELLANVSRAWSLRLAFYQALFELSSTADIVLVGDIGEWRPPFGHKSSRGGGPITLPDLSYPAPGRFKPALRVSGVPTDSDVFLEGVSCSSLHSGIHEAIEQALLCFRKGLYMPATAMLAAAAEATWSECGTAVAKNLSDAKLDSLFSDQYESISKKINELRKAFEKPDGKALLKTAGQHLSKVEEAQVWMTVLRERRNALHWGKANSFIADHSETAALLMGAPQHIGTLEAIRTSC